MEKVFPTIMIVLQLLAAVPYWYQGDWRMGVYWVSASALTTVVTW